MLKNKESKIRILENFFAVDHILLGKRVTDVKACCPALIDEYITSKGALMSVLIDMYNLIEYSPKNISEKVDFKKVFKKSKVLAEAAKMTCKRVMVSSKGKDFIKQQVKNQLTESTESKVNINEVIDETILMGLKTIALDNLLVAPMLAESRQYSKLNEWEGAILEDAYKTLRNDLVELGKVIIDSADE